MAFSFIDIEKEKSRIIAFAFIFIIGIYFLTAYLLLFVIEASSSLISYPPFTHVLYAFAIALIAGFLHWFFSTDRLIEKMSAAVGAHPLDEKDLYHKYFNNIVDEVSVAIGGRKIKPVIIRSSYMNAFALEDFSGRAVIGITEGLLSRLNRSQIEAVVGHEAGHIASGDCLNTTVLCALSEIYEEGVAGQKQG